MRPRGEWWRTAWDLLGSGNARFSALLPLSPKREGAPRVVGVLLASALILFLAALFASARFEYLITRHRESAAQLLPGGKGEQLGLAIERNDLARIRELVAAGADPNFAHDGLPILQNAIGCRAERP